MIISTRYLYVALTSCLLALTGCMDITGRGPAPLARVVTPSEPQTYSRVGQVYCMRGWLGIFSTGMDTLAEKIDKEVGAPAVSVANEEWYTLREWIVAKHQEGKINEPLVLLGHSYGADDMIRVAKFIQDKGITVDLMILLDPVTPPAIPTNVKRCLVIYKSRPATDWYPAWRGVPTEAEDPKITMLTNIDLRKTDVGWDTSVVDHINIEKVASVHNMVMEEIKKYCPTRESWSQQNHQPSATVPHISAQRAPSGPASQ